MIRPITRLGRPARPYYGVSIDVAWHMSRPGFHVKLTLGAQAYRARTK